MADETTIERLSRDLDEGVAADIWFDALDHAERSGDPDSPDFAAARTIEATQSAMSEASLLLRRFHSVLKSLHAATEGTEAYRAAPGLAVQVTDLLTLADAPAEEPEPEASGPTF